MSLKNGTGVDYPQVELGGVTYTVKCTRGALLFRLSRKGASIADLGDPKTRFAALFNIFTAFIGDQANGKTAEDFAELAMEENRVGAVDIAVGQAIPKVFPSTQAPAPAAEDVALLPN